MEDVTLNIRHNADQSTTSVKSLSNAMGSFASNSKKASTNGTAAANGFKKIGQACLSAGRYATKGASGLSKFTSSLGRIAFYRAIRSAIRHVTDSFKEGLDAAYNWSKQQGGANAKLAGAMDALSAASGRMKLQLGAAFGGLIVAIEPVLIRIINLVTAAADAITRFFAVLNGGGYYKKAVGSLNDLGSAAGGAGKQVKGLLASWDELNVIGKESGGGGGGSNSTDYSGMYEWAEAESDWANLFASGDFFGIGAKIGDALGEAAQKFTDFLKKPEIQNFGTNLADTLNGLVENEKNWYKIGETIGTGIGTVTKWIVDFFDNVDWTQVWGAVNVFAKGVKDGVVKELDGEFGKNEDGENKTFIQWLTNIIDPGPFIKEGQSTIIWKMRKFLADILGVFDSKNWENGGNFSFWEGIGSWLEQLFSPLKNGAENVGKWLSDIGTSFDNWYSDTVQSFNDKWSLIVARLEDIPAKLKNYGIKGINGLKSGIESGLNSLIEKWNGSDLVQLLGWELDPVHFDLIPEIPEEELNKNYNKAKAEIEARSKENPTVFDSTANYTDWSVDGSKDKSKVSHFTTWNSTAQWNYQKTGSKWGGTTWNSTAQWNAQKIGPKWAGTTWNSTALFKSYTVDDSLKSNGYLRISATADIKSVTGSSVNFAQAAKGGLYKNGAWRPITSYASGGSPFGGQIFRARENGNPELVGTINGSTAVMNNGQIVASVSAGVARAISNIRFKMVGFGGASISSTPMDNEQIAQNIQNGIERGNEEQNDLLREQNNILLRLLQNGIQLNPSVAFGQVVARSTDLYARA